MPQIPKVQFLDSTKDLPNNVYYEAPSMQIKNPLLDLVGQEMLNRLLRKNSLK